MVIGATPTPAETRETARPRRVSNQRMVVAIIGAKNEPAATPITIPNSSSNSSSEAARLASTSAAPSSRAPASATMRAPNRSLSAPHMKPARPIARKSKVIALEIPVRDQPVAADIGCRNTASENIAPMATQPISAPAATITQRYEEIMSRIPLRCSRAPIKLHAGAGARAEAQPSRSTRISASSVSARIAIRSPLPMPSIGQTTIGQESP